MFFANAIAVNQDIMDSSMDIIEVDKKQPMYLDDYRTQAKKYADKEINPCLPISCLAKASCQTRLVSVHINDLELFMPKFNLEN